MKRMLLLVAIAAFAGCSDRTSVKGRVTFEGKPVERGIIDFEPADGKGSTRGVPIADGGYEVPPNPSPPAAGEYTVRIRAYRSSGKKVAAFPGGPETEDDIRQVIPAEYNEKSKLKATIQAGKANELNFDLPTEKR